MFNGVWLTFKMLERIANYTVFYFVLKAMIVSGFLKTPLNTVAVAGLSVKMECSTRSNATGQWNFYPAGQKQPILLYNGQSMHTNTTDRFKVISSRSNGRNDLLIVNVAMTDAGVYECVQLTLVNVDRSIEARASAVLSVIALECRSNATDSDEAIAEFDYLEVRCLVNISGHWTIFMNWSKQSTPLNATTTILNSKASSVRCISSSVFLQLTAEENGIPVNMRSQIHQNSSYLDLEEANAINIPNFICEWNITFNVHFGPKDISINPSKKQYRAGDVLSCASNGNPRPVYEWRDASTSEIIGIGPKLTIPNNEAEDRQEYIVECIATNRVAGKRKSTKTSAIVKIQGTLWSTVGYVSAAVGGVIFTISCISILAVVKNKLISHTSTNQKNITTEEGQSSSSSNYDSILDMNINSIPATFDEPTTEIGLESYIPLTERHVVLPESSLYYSLTSAEGLPVNVINNAPVHVNFCREIYRNAEGASSRI